MGVRSINKESFYFSRFCKETIAFKPWHCRQWGFYFSRFCKETIARPHNIYISSWFYFSRFCKETIAQCVTVGRQPQFYFSRFCKETIASHNAEPAADIPLAIPAMISLPIDNQSTSLMASQIVDTISNAALPSSGNILSRTPRECVDWNVKMGIESAATAAVALLVSAWIEIGITFDDTIKRNSRTPRECVDWNT